MDRHVSGTYGRCGTCQFGSDGRHDVAGIADNEDGCVPCPAELAKKPRRAALGIRYPPTIAHKPWQAFGALGYLVGVVA